MKMTMAAILVARALMERPNAAHYGYDIAARTRLKSGSVQPMLVRWASRGLLDSWMEDPRKLVEARPARRYFRLTELGSAELTAMLDQARREPLWDGVFATDMSYSSPYVSGSQSGYQRSRRQPRVED